MVYLIIMIVYLIIMIVYLIIKLIFMNKMDEETGMFFSLQKIKDRYTKNS